MGRSPLGEEAVASLISADGLDGTTYSVDELGAYISASFRCYGGPSRIVSCAHDAYRGGGPQEGAVGGRGRCC